LCVGCTTTAPQRTAHVHAKPHTHGVLFEGSF
jgi:hypothetical protein